VSITLHTANRALHGSRKFITFNQHRQIVDLAFELKLKTKYNALAQWVLGSSSVSFCPTCHMLDRYAAA